jgi:hypothetical protein
MKAVTGVFRSKSEAQRSVAEMRSLGLPEDRITLLTLGNGRSNRCSPRTMVDRIARRRKRALFNY